MSPPRKNAPDPSASVPLPDPSSWARLMEDLHRAAEIDQNEPADADMPGHAASWVALHHLYAFLLAQPAIATSPDILAPLARLTSAMVDLRHGRVSPMFKPKRGRGRPPNSSAFEIVKGTAARAMSELMDSGMSKRDASEAVARTCAKVRGNDAITATQVEGWRDTYEAGAGRGAPEDGPGLLAYKRAIPTEFGATSSERAQGLLEALRAAVGSLT